MIEDVGYAGEQDSELEARFGKRQWTVIDEGMLRKILTYLILQQEASAPLNANSSTETITDVGFPLPQDDSELARESRFSYLFNSRGKDKIGFMDDGDSSNQADQELKQLRMIHKSGADVAALCNVCVEVISA